MTNTDKPSPSPEHMQSAEVEAYLAERTQWMGEAVEIVTGSTDGNPLEVFPEPTTPRNDSEGLPLSDTQAVQLREIAERFGIGAERDVLGTAKIRVKEGGKAWKVEAEAKIGPAGETIIFAGSENRKLGQDEVDYMYEKHDVEMSGKTEYDLVRLLAEQQPDFVAQEDEVLPFGYDISNHFELIQDTTGQLVKIGELRGQPVMVLRVDREDFVNEAGENKYRNQPDSAALMSFIGDVLTACGDEESSVGLDTSTTYASRAVDTIRAGLRSDRFFDVGMYGRQTLADVRGLPIAEPTAINQIPGELHEFYSKMLNLQAELQ
ncbi:MAG: hypothetical protein ABIQ89_01315 [Candidatus Saccharimonadales bacterium]